MMLWNDDGWVRPQKYDTGQRQTKLIAEGLSVNTVHGTGITDQKYRKTTRMRLFPIRTFYYYLLRSMMYYYLLLLLIRSIILELLFFKYLRSILVSLSKQKIKNCNNNQQHLNHSLL